MTRKNTSKEISREVQEHLAEGQTKADIFKHLRTKFDDDKLSARFLALWPYPELRRKYRNLNRALIVLLVIVTVAKILFAGLFILSEIPKAFPMLLIVPLINIFLIYLVVKFNGLGYTATALLGFAGLCQMWGSLSDEPLMLDIIINSVLSVIILAAIVLAVMLRRRLLPNSTFFLQPKKDEAGQYIF